MQTKTISARTKAGKAYIAAILRNTMRIDRVEIDNVTGNSKNERAIRADVLARFISIDGNRAALYELSPREFVYLTGDGTRYVTRYTIHTYAMCADSNGAIS